MENRNRMTDHMIPDDALDAVAGGASYQPSDTGSFYKSDPSDFTITTAAQLAGLSTLAPPQTSGNS